MSFLQWFRMLFAIPACWLAAFALLRWQYPWPKYYYQQSHFEWRETLTSYVLVATLLVVVSCVLAPLLTRTISGAGAAALRIVVLRSVIAFALLSVLAILFGPYRFNVKGTTFEGIFFSEWKFITFILYCALPCSILGASVMPWKTARPEQPQ